MSRNLDSVNSSVELKCNSIVGVEGCDSLNCEGKDKELTNIVDTLNYYMSLMERDIEGIRYQIGRI